MWERVGAMSGLAEALGSWSSEGTRETGSGVCRGLGVGGTWTGISVMFFRNCD